MTTQQRSAIDNAIWLCQSCAKMIDSDLFALLSKFSGTGVRPQSMLPGLSFPPTRLPILPGRTMDCIPFASPSRTGRCGVNEAHCPPMNSAS